MSEKLRGWKALLFFILLHLEDLENTKESTYLNIWFCSVSVLQDVSFKLMNKLFEFLWRNQRIQKINLHFSKCQMISLRHVSCHNIRNFFSTRPVPNLTIWVRSPEGDLNMVSPCVVRDKTLYARRLLHLVGSGPIKNET